MEITTILIIATVIYVLLKIKKAANKFEEKINEIFDNNEKNNNYYES